MVTSLKCDGSQALQIDLHSQLNAFEPKCSFNHLENPKISHLMHKIMGCEENEDVLEAKWLHAAWTRTEV